MVDAVLIKIGDTERMFHFNNFALVELGKLLECDPLDAQDKLMQVAADDVFTGLAIVLTAGFIGWEKSQFNLRHGIVAKDIFNAIATCDMNDFTPAWESFKSATGISEFLKQQAESAPTTEEVKKKQTGNKSLSTPQAK